MELISMNLSKGERRKYLPLEIRMRMYKDIRELYEKGLNQIQIQRKIYKNYGMRLPQPTISTWISGKHKPLGKINKFDGKPSRELAYVIGTILSDGYKYFDNNTKYSLILSVKDKEFAEEFGKALAKVLKKNKPYKPYWNKNKKRWIVEGYSILLYKFLDQPLEKLKSYIEHSKETSSTFLKALFDGEGSMYVNKEHYKRDLKLSNTNKELLNYAKYLLKKYFNIDTTGPRLKGKEGRVAYFPNGVYKAKKDYYCIYIRTKSLLNFYKHIGFTIKRKQQRLVEAIKQ